MRRMRSIMAGITANTAGFAALQAQTAGTGLTLASTTPSAPLAGQIHAQAVPVTLTSAGNLSVGTFTVNGLDRRGNPLSEIITGPNANTVTGHMLFGTVNSIIPNTTNATTVSAGWAGKNYGPWLVTAFHQASVIATPGINSGAVTFDVYSTDYDLLDPTVFLPQGAGGDPPGDMQSGGGSGTPNTSGPYLSSLPWPLVPPALQTACPQLLSTVNCLPEDDGTYSEFIVAPTTFTAAAAGTGGTNTASEIRLDPTGAFAWRLVISSATGFAQMDVNVIRPALS